MLDEKKEVQEYLCEIKSDKKPRVLPSNLTDKYENKLNGLQDILVLIAREFIFGFMEAEECTKKVHNDCISALRLWCGFDDDETLDKLKKEPIMIKWLNEYPYADKWLKNYYDKIILPNFKAKSEKKKNVKKEAIVSENDDMWERYVTNWKERLMTPEVNLYSSKRFCYENILADALADGELKVYYLVFNVDENILNASLSKDEEKININTFQKNYKFIAAYLLTAKHSGNQETIYFRKIRFLNWLGHDNDNLRSWFPGLKWKGNDICQRFPGKDFVKLKMNNNFIKNYDIKLIDETELKAYKNKKYTILKDNGHGVALQKVN